jgi:hypothetical protein
MLKGQARKALSKKAKKGFQGYPVATIALYGPSDKKATKLVVGIVPREDADPEQMKKWYSEDDIMTEHDIFEEVLEFIRSNEARTVVMVDRIIGCPHEEGIDYPDGQYCPQCPFWEGRDRWSGRVEH